MADDVKYPDVVVDLENVDGNAMSIIAKVARGLSRAGVPAAEITEFKREATSGDFDNVIQTAMRWVEVE